MRALLVTTLRDADSPELVPIVGIFAEQELAVATSGSLGAGADLVRGLASDIGAAVAILPRGGTHSSGWTAVMVEIGVCIGAGIPVLAVIDPDEKLPPALGALQYVRADLADADTLRLHLSMFVRGARHRERNPDTAKPWFDLERHGGRRKFDTDLGVATQEGLEFEWKVADLLRGPTSLLARGERDRASGPNDGVDLAFSIGDPANPIVVVVEVKKVGPHTRIERGVEQLLAHVDSTGADLGLLITDEHVRGVSMEAHRQIVLLSFAQLQEAVQGHQLESLLRSARNRAVHGA